MTRGPLPVRRSLGRQLKALREGARKHPADVAVAGVASTSKLQRIETGASTIKLVDVWALCRLYGADEATTDTLAEMARNTSEKGWWEPFSELLIPRFGTFIELESSATEVLGYDGELVYGLLQTPAYHQAITEVDPDLTPTLAERHVRLRAERRRAAFDRRPPLRVTAVLGEGAVTRKVGGSKVMDEQLRHLLQMQREPHIQIFVLPWEAGAHAAMKSSFTLVGFDAEAENECVYLETLSGGRYEDQPEVIAKYRTISHRLRQQSVTIEEYLK